MSDPEGSTVNSRLREAAKKVFFSGMATKRGGGGGKGLATRQFRIQVEHIHEQYILESRNGYYMSKKSYQIKLGSY